MADGEKRPRKRPLSAGRGADQFPLRLPEGMREQIKTVAEENGRSMNQEIIEVLREYFPDPPSDEEIMDELLVALAWAKNLDSPMKRHAMSGHLQDFIKKMESRFQRRSDPYVVVDRHILDKVEGLASKLNMPRDEVAQHLLKASLVKVLDGSEKFKASIWPEDQNPHFIEIDIEPVSD